MAHKLDPKFADHFRNLKQVFMYITDRCNINCEQCIYKPSISHFIREEIPLQVAIPLLESFRSLGATKTTFLGGEPTLYGHGRSNEPLLQLIEATRSMGYQYIRIDTNGQYINKLLDNSRFHDLSEIAFSLDGYSPETNDPLRGIGTFDKCVASIRKAISLGYKCTITCCVHREFVKRGENGRFKLDQMIRFAESLGIHTINFHDLFKAGIPMDTWTGNFNPTVEEWVAVYDEIYPATQNGDYGISVRLPQCFVTKEEFARNPKYYGFCPVKLGERVMVHPNGTIRICSNLICTGFGTARYLDDTIEWDHTGSNELHGHDMTKPTPCTNRSRHKSYGKYVPLCFSFKPDQEEHVWQERLQWEQHRTAAEPTPVSSLV
ncbi:MAG: radical SAM protein [Flavobacteriales bacterium]|nr:radical SAM protein [Flavobacteriales bacterium]